MVKLFSVSDTRMSFTVGDASFMDLVRGFVGMQDSTVVDYYESNGVCLEAVLYLEGGSEIVFENVSDEADMERRRMAEEDRLAGLY